MTLDRLKLIFNFSTPYQGMVRLLHPLPAIVECVQLVLLQVDTVLHVLTVHGKREDFGDVASLVVLYTEAEPGVSEERSQSISFNICPTVDGVIHKVEKLLLAVDSQLACGGREGINLPPNVPVPDEDMFQGELLVGVVVDMSIAVL